MQLGFDFEATELEKIGGYYAEALAFHKPKQRYRSIEVSFYPYVGINHTIRVRDEVIFVRIGEICRDMPLAAQRGLAYILVSKLLRKPIPKAARDIYSAYIDRPEIRNRAFERKQTRGRKVVTSSKGNVYDLDEIFEDLNQKYFTPPLKKPALTWSARKTYRTLGHHDAAHDHVAISRSLDSLDVPRYVVEHVVFHEMLHIVHPVRHMGGRRAMHTTAFRTDERKFQHYTRAERWIENNVRRLKRAARKK